MIHLRGDYANRGLNLTHIFLRQRGKRGNEKKKSPSTIVDRISLTDPSKGSKIINSIRHRGIQLKKYP